MMRRHQLWMLWNVVYWSFCVPFWIAKQVYRLTGKALGTAALMNCDAVMCPACEAEVSLVARWECGWCGYSFDGFAFARCELCGAVPPFIECQQCGLAIRNPSIF
jgi:hypothetical protein